MTPIRPDSYGFTFDHKTLETLRKGLGLTQAVLAKELDVPVNTVSRWETGATTPDAKALAALYSVAKSRGTTPQFFTRRPDMKTAPSRTKFIFALDFQNLGVKVDAIQEEMDPILQFWGLRFPQTRSARSLWAYTIAYPQSLSVRQLENLGFEVTTLNSNADAQLIDGVREACKRKPNKTVVVIASNDGDYVELVRDLRQRGVEVFAMGTDDCSERLRKAVGDDHFVHWYQPYVVSECIDVIKELKGAPITKAEFGSRCKAELDEFEVYPDGVGFSRRNPYGSLLQWLEAQGIVAITNVAGKPKDVTIRLLR